MTGWSSVFLFCISQTFIFITGSFFNLLWLSIRIWFQLLLFLFQKCSLKMNHYFTFVIIPNISEFGWICYKTSYASNCLQTSIATFGDFINVWQKWIFFLSFVTKWNESEKYIFGTILHQNMKYIKSKNIFAFWYYYCPLCYSSNANWSKANKKQYYCEVAINMSETQSLKNWGMPEKKFLGLKVIKFFCRWRQTKIS